MTASIIGNQKGIYIDCRNNLAYIEREDLAQAKNYEKMDPFANHVVIFREDNEDMTICQASGYSYKRGMFVDVF